MSVSFNISNASHVPNSQLAANTLNVEINNVLKFYQATITALSKYDTSYSASISDDTTQSDINTIVEELFKRLNNLTFEKGLTLNSGAVGHTNSITATSKGQSTSYSTSAYDKSLSIPYITVDSYGHITALSAATVKIPYQYLTAESLYSGNLDITDDNRNYKTCSLSSSISSNDLLEFRFLVSGEISYYSDGIYTNHLVSGAAIDKTSTKPAEIYVSNSDRVYLYQSGSSTIKIYSDHSVKLVGIIRYKLSSPTN